ncbi:MAG: PIN domain-containing protein [Bifidobacteriaceae bacterium]|nr:PIN domain-containing protein [Bifidobacteriaceae bacterium]
MLNNLDGAVARIAGAVLPITADHAARAGQLDWPHRDPFDRMPAAQAMSEGACLISRDPAFSALPGLRVAW